MGTEIWEKERWDKYYEIENPYQWVGRYREKIRTQLILDHIYSLKPKTALDIGCGEGNLTIELARFADLIDAFDISDTAIQRAKEIAAHPNINYYQLDVKDFKYEGKQYDLIVCTEVIYYLKNEDILKLYEEIRKSLTEEGKFIVASRVDGTHFNFNDVVKLLNKKFQVEDSFTVHSPQTFVHKALRKICERFDNSFIDRNYKHLVSRVPPEKAFQSAFVCKRA